MKRISWHVVIGVLVLGGVVGAATLSDFKNAEGQTGCDSIPYDGIRSTCRGNRDGVRDWCKNSSRPISCENLDPSGLAKQIENMKGKIADLKRERDELSSKISGAKDDSERRALEDKKKATEDKIIDGERNHYLLMYVGWDGPRRVHHVAVHVEVRGDKVWLQCDNTDLVVAEDLAAEGIPKGSIVLGFREPSVRQYTEYAVG